MAWESVHEALWTAPAGASDVLPDSSTLANSPEAPAAAPTAAAAVDTDSDTVPADALAPPPASMPTGAVAGSEAPVCSTASQPATAG